MLTDFFRQTTSLCRLAQQHGFRFCRVSGLDGFEEALAAMQGTTAFVCVSDVGQGCTTLATTPHTRQVTTVFLALRHAIDDMAARQQALDTLREVYRQFLSRLLPERTRLRQDAIYVDERITFQEIDRYFFSGCACAFFSIAVHCMTDLRYRSDEWLPSL